MGKKEKARKARQAKEAIKRFHTFCCIGDLKGVRAALQAGLDVNSETEFGERGLMGAVINGQTAMVSLLLEQKGIEVDIVGAFGDDEYQGASLLSVSALRNHVDCVKLLLSDKRADPNIKDPDPDDDSYWVHSPLVLAVKYNYVDCVKLLLADPRVDLMTRDGYMRSEEEVVR